MFWALALPIAALLAANAAGLTAAEEPGPPGPLLLGRALGLLALVAVALGVAAVATPVPAGLICYTGFLPFLRGFRQLTSGRFRPEPPPAAPSSGRRPWLRAARATVARGADLLAVAVPLFATRTGAEVGALLAACALALPADLIRGPLERRGEAGLRLRARAAGLQPWCLVAIGAHVLIEGGVFNWLMPGR